MEKKVKIYHYYSPPPSHPEKFTKPSLTDTSFFEPLNVLVDKILAGESTTLGDSTRQMYEFADDNVDMDMDSSDYFLDDLTDLDLAKIPHQGSEGILARKQGEAAVAPSSQAPQKPSASDTRENNE